jgi:anti-sigma regulatory factor (Ser/Thr protein kinase)
VIHPVAIAVTEPSQVGEARRAVIQFAQLLGFTETRCGEAAIIVAEAASNLIKHAGGGCILLRAVEQGSTAGLEILALDTGPGMADPERCLRDGFTTAGTPGTGLGAIARLATFTDVYTRPGKGTALVARLWPGAAPLQRSAFRASAVTVPYPGETVCGDGWAMVEMSGRPRVLVVDGLGHGPNAALAARAAEEAFRENAGLGLVEFLQVAHQVLAGTRGAAVAVAEIDPVAEVIRYAGVGNIVGVVVVGSTTQNMVSHNGTVGHEARKFQEFSYSFPRGAVLILHSDGLSSRWTLDAYPGLAVRDPALIAGVLYRDFQRGRDDVTIVVLRSPAETP